MTAHSPPTGRLYLDHAATSPLRPEARAALLDGLANWANPSSPHAEGRRARAALEDARERIKTALGWTGELIFTSGASEAASLALGSAEGGPRLVSAVEHDCVGGAAPDAAIIRVTGNGLVDLDHLRDLAAAGQPVVAVQHVNSETGGAQDIAAVAQVVHEAGGLLLTDCAQSAGKLALPPEADLVMVSAHKFGGPIGIGALLLRDYRMIKPTGGQERGYRRGTENLPAALGMAAALETSTRPYVEPAVLEPLEKLAADCRALGGTWLGDRLARPTPFIQALAMPHTGAAAQVVRLDMAGIAVSQGSACSSGTMKVSRVLEAMGVEPAIAANTIRFSIGWNTTRAEVERFCDAWRDLARGGTRRAA